MISPGYLKKGDRIGIIAPARKVAEHEMAPAINKFREWGLEVVIGDNLFNEFNQFAGFDDERAEDLQQMLNSSSIRAVICARGGYGTVRIIDSLSFENFVKNPKWLIGFSDATVLLSHIHSNFGIETIHAEMPINFPKDGSDNLSTESLRKCLFGEKIEYSYKLSHCSRKGQAKGLLVGGNLSILYSLAGSGSDINTDGKILFIEDIDEYLYHIDRMMVNLKRSGKLSRLAGLIAGGFTDMKDNLVPFGKSAVRIVYEAVGEYGYPVCFDFPAGHIPENAALIMGREAELEVTSSQISLKFMKD
jgi:muramoyltetrapeptide carboxypeptidase